MREAEHEGPPVGCRSWCWWCWCLLAVLLVPSFLLGGEGRVGGVEFRRGVTANRRGLRDVPALATVRRYTESQSWNALSYS